MFVFEKAMNNNLRAYAAVLAVLIGVAVFGASGVLAFGKHGQMLAKNQMEKNPIVVMDTNKGQIKIEVFQNEAPITGGNFLDLVNRGFYNGLSFHRYEPGFVIQGGDPNGNGTGGFVDPQTKRERTIVLEKKKELRHDEAGIVAMARSSDPNSASSQFYITLAPATFLDNPPGYAVFGKVVSGLDVVMQLRAGDKMTKVVAAEGAVAK